MPIDAFLLLSFGGPEGPDDVLPFLRNVTAGRGVPEERLLEVAEHYQHFGGVSPINEQCRVLLRAIEADFRDQGVGLPLYWGNRNWKPLLADTVARMRDDGITHAIALATSAYAGYSSCRQYLEDIEAARAHVGPGAPEITKLPHFYDRPGFIEPNADAVRDALAKVGGDAHLVFTAHSVPVSAARTAGPPADERSRESPGVRSGNLYEDQLREAARLVAERVDPALSWDLVWQSRSGPPQVPWLEPDVNDFLRTLPARNVVVSPIGFVSDHLEVVWDLDTEAAATAAELGMGYARAATAGTDPRFVRMVTDLVQEAFTPSDPRPSQGLGTLSRRQTCGAGCCPRQTRPRMGVGADERA
ncbi:ferrochelatase [Hamadaea tsunoensis]|uniref:ferrochelatase n=1 Tax=Hamadaea tsunoensis TaxID=53368 RepID=UPI00041AB9C9|nr:ferrochelatase [Hamadaea tsunoensis]